MNVSFISLGCDKNRVNTEQMMAMCLQAGMTVQEDVNGSDVLPGRNDDGAAGDRRHDGHRRLR